MSHIFIVEKFALKSSKQVFEKRHIPGVGGFPNEIESQISKLITYLHIAKLYVIPYTCLFWF